MHFLRDWICTVRYNAKRLDWTCSFGSIDACNAYSNHEKEKGVMPLHKKAIRIIRIAFFALRGKRITEKTTPQKKDLKNLYLRGKFYLHRSSAIFTTSPAPIVNTMSPLLTSFCKSFSMSSNFSTKRTFTPRFAISEAKSSGLVFPS